MCAYGYFRLLIVVEADRLSGLFTGLMLKHFINWFENNFGAHGAVVLVPQGGGASVIQPRNPTPLSVPSHTAAPRIAFTVDVKQVDFDLTPFLYASEAPHRLCCRTNLINVECA